MRRMIVWFEEIRATDTELVGGKAANLGECVRAGLPVPPGFCLSTEAYKEATGAIAEELVEDTTREDPAAARRRILDLTLPAPVETAIRDACARLGDAPMAVRSSATAEDLAGASFAGQQDTYLGMRGVDAVLDAGRRARGRGPVRLRPHARHSSSRIGGHSAPEQAASSLLTAMTCPPTTGHLGAAPPERLTVDAVGRGSAADTLSPCVRS